MDFRTIDEGGEKMSRLIEHRRKTIPQSWLFVGLISAFLLISSSLFLLLYPFPSKEKVSYFQQDHPIIFQGKLYEKEALIIDDYVYLPFTFFKEHIDQSAWLDNKTSSVILTNEDKVIQLPNYQLIIYLRNK